MVDVCHASDTIKRSNSSVEQVDGTTSDVSRWDTANCLCVLSYPCTIGLSTTTTSSVRGDQIRKLYLCISV